MTRDVTIADDAWKAPPRRLRVGCGEWGFRNLPMADHFRIAASFGFRELEFGIGGGQPGRLPEAPSPADIAFDTPAPASPSPPPTGAHTRSTTSPAPTAR